MTAEQLDGFQPYVLYGSLGLYLLLETVVPLIGGRERRIWHGANNMALMLIGLVCNGLLAVFLVETIAWAERHQFGLLRQVDLPLGVEVLLTVALFDCTEYWTHRMIRHRNPLIWRFHRVHHADADLDATTTGRVHPGELIVTIPIQMVLQLIVGYPLLGASAYFLTFTAFTMLQHANLSLPHTLDKWLSYVFITPNVHKVHHSDYQPETDSNFADIFSVWDRLFGTFRYPADVRAIRFGLVEYPREVSTSLWHLLVMPFRNTGTSRERNS
ncbi:sterol desaturase family protein [Spirosoma taeanense]|uniref:Sterol desaturase family protein n=1 Tax=Spirosoma taeanense TaxID=2735870 RepID=A0A6M5Y7P3_9BACT|nr:sterol desaturase family protein [Spirosoma taeanense]QJW89915.1 sterol desaturase family protein [Spirosoma taeanense]